MARRRFRSNQRHEPVTERSFQEYLYSSGAPQTSRTELMRLVRGGEDTFLELKVKLSNSERIAQEIVALANTGGGVIVFGVNDQLRVEGIEEGEAVQDELVRICREEIVPSLIPFIDRIAFDNGRRILALDVNGKRRPYRTRDGRFFVRVGAEKREASPEELATLFDDARPLSYESLPALGASVGDIDEAHLWSFMRAFEGGAFDEASVKDYPTAEMLERHLLLATNSGSEIVPTVGGLLLFGRDESVASLLPRAQVIATRFGGDTNQSPVIERIEISGNLATTYESALRFVTRYCDLQETRVARSAVNIADDVPVPARANYHRDVVTEAISNAMIHRDLALRDITTRLNVFDRSIEIVNPRRSAGFAPAALKAIRFGAPQRLNPQIAAVFSNAAYGLTLPSGGLPMLLHEARSFSNRLPDIAAFNDEFRLRLHGI
ncbi:MAG TPA: RNA-binding domain-containing protein [Pyrinomonadaceae bacterium]|nr:RNA-binding domain-containing protein [Pyrinomonadaceae bacterium]